MAASRPLRILQVGLGGFGRAHLGVWRTLAAEQRVLLVGAVVASEHSREILSRTLDVPVFRGVEGVPAGAIDAVDIVTPVASHFDLVGHFLPRAHVHVEKPLAQTAAQAHALAALAAASDRILAVGHVYRFHPLIRRLHQIVAGIPERPAAVFGSLINPAGTRPAAVEPALEMLHWFDLIDFLYGERPERGVSVREGDVDVVSLRYPGAMNAVFRLGWAGTERVRSLELLYRDRSVQADLVDHTITLDGGGEMRKLIFPHRLQALEAELREFVTAIGERRPPAVDAATGARIVEIAERARPRPLTHAPKVAVIGGGIFGATCAAELGRFCEVTLFERHHALCEEASTLNQWRYHHGFHYPRSAEMIREIQECRPQFERVYGDAVLPGISSYYSTVPTARVISRERYLHICTSMGLPFAIEPPPDGILDRSRIDLCLKTNESVIDVERLRRIMQRRLDAAPNVTLAFGYEVVDGELLADGRKRVVARDGTGRAEDSFDYVVNASYANRNLLAKLFGFPVKPLRFDLLELLVLELPIPPVSVTVLDGPFTSLVATATPQRFTLSHIQHSVLASVTPADGLPPIWADMPSNRENLIDAASRYLPILKTARLAQPMRGTRVVHALPEDVDGRPTVVTDHGFGCWSILGGKINTSVTNACQLADRIALQQGLKRPEHGPDRGPERWPASTDDGEEWRDRLPTGARRR
ncbi:MAG TPA: FAD-dependent oxidoreductase [Stellaceae bacterium]